MRYSNKGLNQKQLEILVNNNMRYNPIFIKYIKHIQSMNYRISKQRKAIVKLLDRVFIIMNKKILITGCSGYIGSHLTKMLKDEYEVHGLDIVQPQLEVNEHHTIDIRRMFTLDQEYDAVIHLAALVNVGESEQKPIQYYITNLNGTMNVLNKIKTKKIRKRDTESRAI